MTKEQIAALIRMTFSVDEAKEIMSENFETLSEKIAFLYEMFDVQIIDATGEESEEYIYELLINSVVNYG